MRQPGVEHLRSGLVKLLLRGGGLFYFFADKLFLSRCAR